MESDKIAAGLKATMLNDPAQRQPVTVVFARVVPPDELAALGLRSVAVTLQGGTSANGELDAAAIRGLAARDDVLRIAQRPGVQFDGG